MTGASHRGRNRRDSQGDIPGAFHDDFTGFEWHLVQSVVGNATVPWQRPQYRPSNTCCIVYFVDPFFTPKMSGWQDSQPFHTECFLCEKMISGRDETAPSML